MPPQQPIHDYVVLDGPWDCEVPVTYANGKIYFSLRILCDIIEVKAQAQIERIQADTEVLGRFLQQVPIKTRTGTRLTWAIEERGIGWWIATMRRGVLGPRWRAQIIEFQEALIDEAHRRFFSESERNPLAELRAQIITLERKWADQERYTRMLEERIADLESRA